MANDAQVISFDAPTAMSAGEVATARLALKNTGTAAWAPPAFCLRSTSPPDNETFGPARRELPAIVVPGAEAVFELVLTPTAAGSHALAFQMAEDGGSGPFGQVTPPKTVAVNSNPPPPLPQFPAPGDPLGLLWCPCLDTGLVPIPDAGVSASKAWVNQGASPLRVVGHAFLTALTAERAGPLNLSASVTRISDGALVASLAASYAGSGPAQWGAPLFVPQGGWVVAPGDGFLLSYAAREVYSYASMFVRHTLGAWALPG